MRAVAGQVVGAVGGINRPIPLITIARVGVVPLVVVNDHHPRFPRPLADRHVRRRRQEHRRIGHLDDRHREAPAGRVAAVVAGQHRHRALARREAVVGPNPHGAQIVAELRVGAAVVHRRRRNVEHHTVAPAHRVGDRGGTNQVNAVGLAARQHRDREAATGRVAARILRQHRHRALPHRETVVGPNLHGAQIVAEIHVAAAGVRGRGRVAHQRTVRAGRGLNIARTLQAQTVGAAAQYRHRLAARVAVTAAVHNQPRLGDLHLRTDAVRYRAGRGDQHAAGGAGSRVNQIGAAGRHRRRVKRPSAVAIHCLVGRALHLQTTGAIGVQQHRHGKAATVAVAATVGDDTIDDVGRIRRKERARGRRANRSPIATGQVRDRRRVELRKVGAGSRHDVARAGHLQAIGCGVRQTQGPDRAKARSAALNGRAIESIAR